MLSTALIPPYSTPQPNEPISLYRGSVEIQVGSRTIATGNSHVYFNWLPTPALAFDITDINLNTSENDFRTQVEEEIQLVLFDAKIEIDAHLTKLQPCWREGSIAYVSGFIDDFTFASPKEGKHARYILGHLANFPRLIGEWISRHENGGKHRARVLFESNDWKIIIDNINAIDEIINDLSVSGGYAITSTVRIESLSGQSSLEKTEEIIHNLYFFFSFVVGRYAPIILPVGFNSNDEKIWHEWKNCLISQYQSTISWFSGKKTCDALGQIFPNFIEKLSDDAWCEAIQRAIVWYVESNRPTIDPSGRIIWVQSALELLSWTYFVISIDETTGGTRKTEEEFENTKPAAKKIQIFLKELNIPTSFSDAPSGLKNLERFIEDNKLMWKSKRRSDPNLDEYLYLNAFVEVRNDIVHPQRRYTDDDLFWIRVEALNLGLWYLELSLLKLCNYQGVYMDRLERSNNAVNVPWV